MDGEDEIMKIYSCNGIEENVEFLMNHQELKTLLEMLVKFESKIEQYKKENKGGDLGFTHVHYKDYNRVGKKSDVDIVFYINLNEQLDG